MIKVKVIADTVKNGEHKFVQSEPYVFTKPKSTSELLQILGLNRADFDDIDVQETDCFVVDGKINTHCFVVT